VSQTPGGAYERFIEEVGETATGGEAAPPAAEQPPDAEKLVVIGTQYGIETVSPLP
jgi:hypothetical protein